MAIEKPGKLRDFFSYFVATLYYYYGYIAVFVLGVTPR